MRCFNFSVRVQQCIMGYNNVPQLHERNSFFYDR
uniref:Uncharacterized protein n=1 Tax=Anguilla anguilla TaxID=7936 RepID=A0A0E9UXC3_ANGAN